MTRKDYIAIAGAIKDVRDRTMRGNPINHAGLAVVEVLAGHIAAVMAEDNANFNPKTFFTACGLYTGK